MEKVAQSELGPWTHTHKHTLKGHMDAHLHTQTHRGKGNDTAEKRLQWHFSLTQTLCTTVITSQLATIGLHKQNITKFKLPHI